MASALIGSTGFVGANLLAATTFDELYHSRNIHSIKGKSFSTVVCAGIPASMWMANHHPDQDLAQINSLLDILATITAKHFVLISSIAVYQQPVRGFDENSATFEQSLAYGHHRWQAEKRIQTLFAQSHIIRLPALFGIGLKKNFLFDLLNQAPSFMPNQAFKALRAKVSPTEKKVLSHFYHYNPKRNVYEYHHSSSLSPNETSPDNSTLELIALLQHHQATSLQFTHAQSKFQWYSLSNLWSDIQTAISNDLSSLNICSPPITAQALAKQLFDLDFTHQTATPALDYDMHSCHAHLWHSGEQNYLYSRSQVKTSLQDFIANYNMKLGSH